MRNKIRFTRQARLKFFCILNALFFCTNRDQFLYSRRFSVPVMGRKIHEQDYFHLDFFFNFLAHHVVTMSGVKKSQRVEIVFQSDMVKCDHFHLHFRHEKKTEWWKRRIVSLLVTWIKRHTEVATDGTRNLRKRSCKYFAVSSISRDQHLTHLSRQYQIGSALKISSVLILFTSRVHSYLSVTQVTLDSCQVTWKKTNLWLEHYSSILENR